MLSVHCLRFVSWPSYDLSWFVRCQSSHVGNSSSLPYSLWFCLIIAVVNKGEEKFPTIIIDLFVFDGLSGLCWSSAYKNLWCVIYELNKLFYWNVPLYLWLYFFPNVNFVWNYYSHSNVFIINVYIEFLLLLLIYIFIKYIGHVYILYYYLCYWI